MPKLSEAQRNMMEQAGTRGIELRGAAWVTARKLEEAGLGFIRGEQRRDGEPGMYFNKEGVESE